MKEAKKYIQKWKNIRIADIPKRILKNPRKHRKHPKSI